MFACALRHLKTVFCVGILAVSPLFSRTAHAQPSESAARDTIVVEGGAAFIPRAEKAAYGFGALSYFHRWPSDFGWRMSAGAGPVNGFKLFSGGVDYVVAHGAYVGAGLGLAFPTHELDGSNSIIIPLPEATVGYLTEVGGVSILAHLTYNAFLGARVGTGIGWTF